MEQSNLSLTHDEVTPGEEEIGEHSNELIRDPFDASKVRIEARILTLDLLMNRMRENEIVLRPDFQRDDVWSLGAKSRLIESILIRIPIPAFYMDGTNDNNWLVVDGQQRLNSLKDFAVNQSLKLTELEFLQEYDSCTFRQLPRDLQRRINETQVTAYVIQPGTPEELKFNVFKRINTGGLPLSSQEIRHALNIGTSTKLLKELASNTSFLRATTNSLGSHRMVDREYVLRFLAFLLNAEPDLKTYDLDTFLHMTMKNINSMNPEKCKDLEGAFVNAMNTSYAIHGVHAFRKPNSEGERRKPLNKALFESWSVNLATLSPSDRERLISRKDALLSRYAKLWGEEEFVISITQATSAPSRVRTRFRKINEIITETLKND